MLDTIIDWINARLPFPRPIALSDRRPGKSDCTEEGYCWFGGQPLRGIDSIYWSWELKHRHSSLAEYERYWLPANVRQLPARIPPGTHIIGPETGRQTKIVEQ